MVSKLALRSHLDQHACDRLMALPHRITELDRTSFIAREGEKAQQSCLLLSGFVYRYKLTGTGARQICSVHVGGDLVDFQNGLLGHSDYNVQPLTAALVALIPCDALVAAAADCAQIARALWTDIAANTSILAEWLLSVGQRNARQRICHLLCELALRQELAGARTAADYTWPMTQEQLGDATGLTSVHVNRTLQALRADGLLHLSSRHLTILNWRRLRDEGDFTAAYLHLPAADRANEAAA
jgi:CRP-like cAMP-binding protein